VGSEWPSPNGDPCETYTCEAVAGMVQKIQKIQKCDVQCELVYYSEFFYIDMMLNKAVSYVLVYLMTLYHLYWLGRILERRDGVMWTGLVWLRIGTGGELL
jgi:hypothetical protein